LITDFRFVIVSDRSPPHHDQPILVRGVGRSAERNQGVGNG